jgi:hypothetical protein
MVQIHADEEKDQRTTVGCRGGCANRLSLTGPWHKGSTTFERLATNGAFASLSLKM